MTKPNPLEKLIDDVLDGLLPGPLKEEYFAAQREYLAGVERVEARQRGLLAARIRFRMHDVLHHADGWEEEVGYATLAEMNEEQRRVQEDNRAELMRLKAEFDRRVQALIENGRSLRSEPDEK